MDSGSSSHTEIIAGVRDPERAGERISIPDVRMTRFDFEDPGTFSSALQGIDRFFLVRPPAISNVRKYIRPVIEQAVVSDVSHIVFLSLQGVEENPVVPHHRIEKYIVESGISYTFLRPSFFMQNLSTTHREEIRERDELFIPAGSRRFNFIDVRDIGEAAALVLSHPERHENQKYELTGPRNYDFFEIARILSEVLERTIEYMDPSALGFLRRKRQEGYPLMHITVMILLYRAGQNGGEPRITDTIGQLLGRAPISFQTFAEDYRHRWE